jgi:hypothetical protein
VQRRHPQWRAGVSRNDRPVACGSIGPSPQTQQACAQRELARLCGGAIGWRHRRAGWRLRSRSRRAVEGPPSWSATGAAMGGRPGARSKLPGACLSTSRIASTNPGPLRNGAGGHQRSRLPIKTTADHRPIPQSLNKGILNSTSAETSAPLTSAGGAAAKTPPREHPSARAYYAIMDPAIFIEAEQANLSLRVAEAREHVSDGLRRLAEQHEAVKALERDGRPAASAKLMLAALVTKQRLSAGRYENLLRHLDRAVRRER